MREVTPEEPLRILLLSDKVDHASSDLRGMKPLALLERAGLALVGVHSIQEVINSANPKSVDPEDPDSRIREFARDLNLCDMIVIPQTTSIAWGSLVPYWQDELGKVVVIDTDDDIRYVSPLSPAYATRGTEEVTVRVRLEDGTEKKVPLWKDGEKEGDTGQFGDGTKPAKAPSVKFSLADNRIFQKMYLDTMKRADAVTCPTPRYAETLRKEINPRSYCLPNCLDMDEWKDGRHPGREGFRICWHGGDSHRIDVMAAAEGLQMFLEKHPDATFVLVGANLNEWLRCVPPDQLEYWDWASYDAHSWRLMSLGNDVGLCPVVDHKFNDAKSPLKWTEFGACGVPAICSKHPPYSDAVRDGEDGILVRNTPTEWAEALEKCYNDAVYRKQIGRAARARMEADFSIYEKAVEWNSVYRKIMADRKAATIVKEVA